MNFLITLGTLRQTFLKRFLEEERERGEKKRRLLKRKKKRQEREKVSKKRRRRKEKESKKLNSLSGERKSFFINLRARPKRGLQN